MASARGPAGRGELEIASHLVGRERLACPGDHLRVFSRWESARNLVDRFRGVLGTQRVSGEQPSDRWVMSLHAYCPVFPAQSFRSLLFPGFSCCSGGSVVGMW